MSEYTLPTTLSTISVVTCVWPGHVVECQRSHHSPARRGEEAIHSMHHNSQQYSHSLIRSFPSSSRRSECIPPHGTHVPWQCSVSRLKELPENYSNTISLEHYRVALGHYRPRFHPVNDLAPYINQAGGASFEVKWKGNSNTPDHIRCCLHAPILSTTQRLLAHAGSPTPWPPARLLLPCYLPKQ